MMASQEHFWAVFLNSQNHYTMDTKTKVSVDRVSASLVHPREVLGPALREGASSLILIHNHPSGDPTPSREVSSSPGSSSTGQTCWTCASTTSSSSAMARYNGSRLPSVASCKGADP